MSKIVNQVNSEDYQFSFITLLKKIDTDIYMIENGTLQQKTDAREDYTKNAKLYNSIAAAEGNRGDDGKGLFKTEWT